MNDTSMCLLNLSLTDKARQMSFFNGITTELPDGDAAKVWKNMFNLFLAKYINKKNEFKSEFVKSTVHSAETNPDEWFTEHYFIRRRLEEDYKCTIFVDVKMLNQIIYNTIPAAYMMQLTVIK
jgi:hypothetical protein